MAHKQYNKQNTSFVDSANAKKVNKVFAIKIVIAK